jgi:hypothetical protein
MKDFKKRIFFPLVFFLSVSTWSFVALAQSSQDPLATVGEKRFFRGVRALGMGGAQTAVSNDETTLYVNPANLLRLRDVITSVFDWEMEYSENIYYPVYKTQPFGNPFNPEKVMASLDRSRKDPLHFRMTLNPSFVSQYFGLGLIQSQTLSARVSLDGQTGDLFFRDDQGLFFALAARLLSGHVKIGGAVKVLSRMEIDKQISLPGDTSLAGNLSSGSGLGYDGSVVITFPTAYHPTLSFVARDIGGTVFDKTIYNRQNTATKPRSQDQLYDVAFALFPNHGDKLRSTVTYEIQNFEEFQKSSDKIRFSHLGYEFNYHDILFLRAGLNQRHWTLGLEIASERSQFQWATYGEDMGAPGTLSSSRRYVFKWGYRF